MTDAGLIDFTMHIAGERSLEDAVDLTRVDAYARIESLAADARAAGVTGGNVMLLDTNLFRRDGAVLVQAIADHGFATTITIDPRAHDAETLLEMAAAAGCRGLKFHPYLQDLADVSFPAAAGLAKRAENHGMWVAVCCSYGTVRVHTISGPRLVAALVRSGVAAPIVALHAGGAAALEVMSIALEAPNVFLETSFSIPYWNESSVEQDLAFAMRKVGASRCLYGSDHPHVPVGEAPGHLRHFLKRHGFELEDVATIFHGTAVSEFGF